MEIVYHIGANCTDADKLVRSLGKNARLMAPRDIHIPLPAKYRRLLRETIQNLAGASPAEGTRDILLDAITDPTDCKRLVMSNSAFVGLPVRVFEAGVFYGQMEMKLRALGLMFPVDDLHIGFALRNPATFIPALWKQVQRGTFQGFMNGIDPMDVRWSDLIARIRATLPRARITVWCNEDTPLIWGTVLRRLIGVEDDTPVNGEYDLLSTIMSQPGMARFESYLRSHPPQSQLQLRRVIAAFLDKYALPDEIEEEIELPDWDAQLVDDMTRAYEDDVNRIGAMPGVEFIAP